MVIYHIPTIDVLYTEIGNSNIKSEAEVIAVKIQDFKRIPTSYLSYHRYDNRSKVEIIFYLPNVLIFLNKNRAHI